MATIWYYLLESGIPREFDAVLIRPKEPIQLSPGEYFDKTRMTIGNIPSVSLSLTYLFGGTSREEIILGGKEYGHIRDFVSRVERNCGRSLVEEISQRNLSTIMGFLKGRAA